MNSFRCQNLRYSCQGLLRRQELPIMRSWLGNTKLKRNHLNAHDSPFASRTIFFILFHRREHYNLSYSESCNLANRYPSAALLTSIFFHQLFSLNLSFFHYLSIIYINYVTQSQEWELILFVIFSQDMLSNWLEWPALFRTSSNFQAAIKYR